MSESGTQSSASPLYDVVVVGAGLAGLTAAHNILSKDPQLRVLVLEARNRVGGRTLTQPVKVAGDKTENFDLGGQWVGPTQEHLLRLLRKLNIDTFPQNVTGTKVMLLAGDTVRTYESDIPAFGSWWALVEFQLFIWKVERMVQHVPILDPYSSPYAHELEGLTVAAFGAQHLRTRAAREAIDVAVKATFGTDAARLDALFFLAYANAAGGMMKLFEAKHSAQESRVKGGTQAISQRLASLIGEGNILFSHAVTAVDQTAEKDIVRITYQRHEDASNQLSGQKKVLRATKVVMTAPPVLLMKVDWSPPLHPLKKYIYDNMQMGHLNKFIVTYERATWLERGYSGEIVSTGGSRSCSGCSTGPLSVCYDATTNGHPAIVGFFGGRAAVEWGQKTRLEREEAVVASLVEHLGPEMRSYIAYEEKIWVTDPWSGGCPSSHAAPGAMFAMPHIRTPEGNVHFGGTETATTWTGYMSGAVQSGERAAWEVLAAVRPELLTEEERRLAMVTGRVPGLRLAPPPARLPWKLLTAVGATVVAAAVALW